MYLSTKISGLLQKPRGPMIFCDDLKTFPAGLLQKPRGLKNSREK
ncbi:hypothetical protein [Proteus phage P2-71]|nr:hypothetical protein [Proteus phage P2-71]